MISRFAGLRKISAGAKISKYPPLSVGREFSAVQISRFSYPAELSRFAS